MKVSIHYDSILQLNVYIHKQIALDQWHTLEKTHTRTHAHTHIHTHNIQTSTKSKLICTHVLI